MAHYPTVQTEDATLPVIEPKFETLIETWLTAADISDVSREAYRRNSRDFTRWFGQNTTRKADRATILAYKKHLIERKFTAATQSNYLTSIRQFFRYLERETGFPDPTRDIKGIRHPSGHRKDALSLEQLQDLFAVIPTDTLKGLRDAAVVNLAARCGLRGCELSRASIQDLIQKNGVHILKVQGKGKLESDAFVVVGPDCYKHLSRYLSQRGATKASDPLFASTSDNCFGARIGTTSLRKLIKKYLRKIGINTPRITAHSLRHTAVSLALEAGSTLLECSQMARHEAITTTMVYSHQKHRIETAAELKLESLLNRVSGMSQDGSRMEVGL